MSRAVTGARSVLAWHFVREDKILGYGDGRPAVVGEWLSVDPEKLSLCDFGLHASAKLRDALCYAPGPVLCRVELSGRILTGDDKYCAEKRRVVAMADATELLFEMACTSAERVLTNIPDGPLRVAAAGAIDARRRWLKGNCDDAQLSAAETAAWSAVESAVESAAESAAWSAAESAARSAAWSAAESAARSAAETAAWSAAESAAESAARSAAETAAWSAVESAAESAAWSAAESAQNDVFTSMALRLLNIKEDQSL